MEPKFVNQYTRTDEVDRELYRYRSFHTVKNIICYIILAICFLVNIVYYILFGYLPNLIVAVCSIAAYSLFIISYYRALNISKKRLNEMSNNTGKMRIRAELTESELVYTNEDTDNTVTLPVTQFRKSFVTKNYYMVITEGKLVYAFRKGCFTTGKEEELYPFLEQILTRNKSRNHS